MTEDAVSREHGRRSEFAYWVTEQRLADWTIRAVLTRTALTVGAMGVTISSARTVKPPPWWAWPLVILPFVGVYLAGRIGQYVRTGRRPHEPLARWASRVASDTQGSMSINVSGITETIGVACLAALGPWALRGASTEYRLVAVVIAAGWLASYTSAIMVDVAWYNPGVTSWPPWESLRRGAGVAAGLILAAVTLPAPWPAPAREIAAVICASLVAVQIRINETDRTLKLGAVYAGQRDMEGRRAVTTALHTLVGNPLIHLKRKAAAEGPEFFDAVRQVEGGYRETLALDRGVDVTIDWPGVLASRLDAIAGQYGINVSFAPPSQPMIMSDREVARFVLDDLTENAAKAGARLVSVELRLAEGAYRAVVTDDGPGFAKGTWQRSGGGLQRLQALVESRGGSLALSRTDTVTVVTAEWRAAMVEGLAL